MRALALLAAAGRGERLGGRLPKAFVEIAGEPLLAHAVRTLGACPGVEGFVVAAPQGMEDETKAIADGPKLLGVVTGGATRQDSVARALEAAPPGFDAVVCHDVARPLATPDLFAAVLEALDSADGAVPGVRVPDTVKRVAEGRVAETVPRAGLVLAQTPQAFRRGPLERAHRAAAEDGFEATDDAMLLERAGYSVVVVPGDPANVKITGPGDLERAAALLRRG